MWGDAVAKSPATPVSRVGFEPELASHPGVHAFHAYWLELRGSRRFPAKSDIDLERLKLLLGNVLLLAVHHDPLDFEYRVIGDNIVLRLGSLRGKRVREAALLNTASAAYANYCAVVETGQPQFFEGVAFPALRSDRPTLVSRVHCPLANDGKRISHIFSYVAFLDK
jgi:PAS domain